MVKLTDKSNYSRFARPASEDEGIWLDHVEVHLVTHTVGQVKPMHTHDPPQDHITVIRSGRMRWTVEDQTLEAEAGDVIVTLRGVSTWLRGPRRRARARRVHRLAHAAEAEIVRVRPARVRLRRSAR